MNKTFKSSFNEEWLFETPMDTGYSAHNPFDDLVLVIQTNKDSHEIIDVSTNLKKMIIDTTVIYWYETNGNIDIITEFKKVPSGLYVELTGKNNSSNIHASDFYKMVLQDSNRLIFSGDVLSSQGFGIWNQLLKSGNKLFVYDTDNALNRSQIETEDELKYFFQGSTNYRKYRFVLSESLKDHSAVTTSFDLLRTYILTHGVDLSGNKI